MADAAIRFLEQRPEGKPFCLAVSFSDPHAPHVALRKYEPVYPLDSMQLHPTREGELDEKARRFPIKWRASGADRAAEEDKRRFMAVYYSMISWVDENVGRILDRLEALGLADDTVVVFTSDHGEFCFEHGMAKKDLVLLDSLLHVPLVVSWPGVLEPSRLEGSFVEEVDVVPFLCDLLGLDVPEGVQGRSFLPWLRGEAEGHRDAVFAEICPPWLNNPYEDYESFRDDWERNHETEGHLLCWTAPFNVPGDYNKAIRTETHKYIWYASGEEELYDLTSDPHEWHNLAGDPTHEETKLRLKLRLLEWNALSEDPLDPAAEKELQKQYPAWCRPG
jgi:arylsulfatase A-like enzyme